MTSKEIAQMVKEIGLPYAYYQFPNDTEQPTPFVCFYIENNDDMYADDKNYTNIAKKIKEHSLWKNKKRLYRSCSCDNSSNFGVSISKYSIKGVFN